MTFRLFVRSHSSSNRPNPRSGISQAFLRLCQRLSKENCPPKCRTVDQRYQKTPETFLFFSKITGNFCWHFAVKVCGFKVLGLTLSKLHLAESTKRVYGLDFNSLGFAFKLNGSVSSRTRNAISKKGIYNLTINSNANFN